MSEASFDSPSAGETRAYAIRVLGQREFSRFELAQRIGRKWPHLETDAIEDLLDALQQEGLQSDERFAESYTRSAIRRQQGPLKIRAALRSRGLADTLISQELGRHADRWLDLAVEWLERQHPGPLDFNARGRYYRRLLNRGFTHDQAMDALNRL